VVVIKDGETDDHHNQQAPAHRRLRRQKADIDTMLERLTKLSDNHLSRILRRMCRAGMRVLGIDRTEQRTVRFVLPAHPNPRLAEGESRSSNRVESSAIQQSARKSSVNFDLPVKLLYGIRLRSPSWQSA
jgi:hypothetical protein